MTKSRHCKNLGHVVVKNSTLDTNLQAAGNLFTRLNSLSLHDRSNNSGSSNPQLAEEMPIRRKRSSPTMEESRSKRPKYSQARRCPSSGSELFNGKQCIAWFHEYTGPDEDTLGPDGMEKFCEDIGVEPENIVMLSLAYTLDAKSMGFFTLAEWLKGMTELQCDSVSKIRQKLEYLRNLLDDSVQFKNIYRYAFDFARDKDQRSMDMDTAKAMLTLLLGRKWPLFTSFHQYLDQSKYKVINKDQWCNILEFSRSIAPDLSNYDEDGAWPVLLDEFVDWYRDQRQMLS
ncbi:hypothetical protein DPMN_104412 [Dreissena polymorpha]|uniref:Defective in cullin neddylation protein n=2 Tax=Dreissena polymorpha TaxID=45954 RepID=A0A9D4HBJ3_DREPO|nr:hypothetical protein DPMN_104412 [Dreissena polymorpha]